MIFKQRKNKRFNFKGRYQQERNDASENVASKWSQIKERNKRKGTKFNSILFFVVLLIMVLILWYILKMYE